MLQNKIMLEMRRKLKNNKDKKNRSNYIIGLPDPNILGHLLCGPPQFQSLHYLVAL